MKGTDGTYGSDGGDKADWTDGTDGSDGTDGKDGKDETEWTDGMGSILLCDCNVLNLASEYKRRTERRTEGNHRY